MVCDKINSNTFVTFPQYINIVCWIVAAIAACLVVYGLHDAINGHPLDVDVAALYNSTHRTVWGACLCWVIFACATGNGGNVYTGLGLGVPRYRKNILRYIAIFFHRIAIYCFHYIFSQIQLISQDLPSFWTLRNRIRIIYMYI